MIRRRSWKDPLSSFFLLFIWNVFTSALYVDLSRQGLVEVPTGISHNVRTLILMENTIKSILPGQFSHCIFLERLDLSHNEISSIASDAFLNAKLVKINLSYNKLERLPDLRAVKNTLQNISLGQNMIHTILSNDVKDMTRLRHLDIIDNFVRDISFVSVLSSLEYFRNTVRGDKMVPFGKCFQRLSNLNNLELVQGSFGPTLPNDSFAGTRIHSLRLNRVSLQHVPDLKVLNATLVHLIINKNKFTEKITFSDFEGLEIKTLEMKKCKVSVFPDLSALKETLEKLDLRENRISFIPNSTFLNFTELTTVKLTDNSLSAFPHFPAEIPLLELSVTGAPFMVDCSKLANLMMIQSLEISSFILSGDNDLSCISDTVTSLQLYRSPSETNVIDFLLKSSLKQVHLEDLNILTFPQVRGYLCTIFYFPRDKLNESFLKCSREQFKCNDSTFHSAKLLIK